MMRAALLLLAFGLVSACGVDGAPQPVRDDDEPGVAISGTATIGVGGRF